MEDDPVVQVEGEAKAWGLSDLEYRFCTEYHANKISLTDAFERVYDLSTKIPRKKITARATRCFNKRKVQKFLEYLKNRQLMVVTRNELKRKLPDAETYDESRIKTEEACIAFSNPKELFDEDGNAIPICDLPDHVARAIREFEGLIIEGEGGRRICLIKKIRFWDKGDALRRLELMSGMLKEGGVNVSVTLTSLLQQIDGQSKGKLPSEVG
jgi:hypothetical protein